VQRKEKGGGVFAGVRKKGSDDGRKGGGGGEKNEEIDLMSGGDLGRWAGRERPNEKGSRKRDLLFLKKLQERVGKNLQRKEKCAKRRKKNGKKRSHLFETKKRKEGADFTVEKGL